MASTPSGNAAIIRVLGFWYGIGNTRGQVTEWILACWPRVGHKRKSLPCVGPQCMKLPVAE